MSLKEEDGRWKLYWEWQWLAKSNPRENGLDGYRHGKSSQWPKRGFGAVDHLSYPRNAVDGRHSYCPVAVSHGASSTCLPNSRA